jgi:hypothetical protein
MNLNLIDLNREIVLNDYKTAIYKNKELYINGDIKASEEYIYDNQKEDAHNICNKFYETQIRVISIVKRTKVGMDGLMIEIAKNMTTHSDNNFIIHRDNIFFITAMSNIIWEEDMKYKTPTCFKNNVYHHGKLKYLKQKLKNIKNAIIINDEIDCGDKEEQKLHLILKESGILDINYMKDNNIRFIFVSATMINELQDLYKWGEYHYTYYMTIPNTYIGHKEFLKLNIIQEYYPINNTENAEKWITEDIIDNYGKDYRVHIIRTDEKNKNYIFNACIKYNIQFKNHTSTERIEHNELLDIFNNITNHLVLVIKGFYRRANLIPNEWKKKIGATHERYVKKYDTNVQVQGLPGRMSGYWKSEILNGHKTGPHRTSIDAINEYEEFYNNPFNTVKYNTNGSKKLFMNPKHIQNLKIKISNPSTNKRIPVIITELEEKDIIFNNLTRPEKLRRINTILKDKGYTQLYNFINNETVICAQITQPNSNDSYKKHITDVVNANKNNISYIVDVGKKYKDKNNWQVFIDNRQYRLCFIIWCVDSHLYK